MTRLSIRQVLLSAGFLLVATGTAVGRQRETASPPLEIGAPAVEAGPNYHHASTAMQGYLDGLARWLRGLGLARYNNSLALRHEQAARQHALQNAILQVETYFERIRRNREHRRSMRSPRRVNRVVGVRRKPMPLPSAEELDRETGVIAWPHPLRVEAFALQRQQLEQLFTERRYCETGVGSGNQLAVRAAIQEMRGTLARCIRQHKLDYDGYTIARQFLDRLNSEARL